MSKVILGDDKEESQRKRKSASAAGPHQNHEENPFLTLYLVTGTETFCFPLSGFLSDSLLMFGALSQDREGPQARPALFSFRIDRRGTRTRTRTATAPSDQREREAQGRGPAPGGE